MEDLLTTQALISLLTLTVLEIILGIDNVIFISIITDRLPEHQEDKGRVIGLMFALIVRILLLLGLSTLMTVGTKELFQVNLGQDEPVSISIRSLILICGGLFLIAKSTSEIHHKMEEEGHGDSDSHSITMLKAILQIVAIDVVFSFDSILTAVGLVQDVKIMIIAVVISMAVMIAFAKKVSEFIEAHPTFKVLALSFLVLVGFLLTIEGLGVHVSKGYVYFAIAFSFIVEIINSKIRKKSIKRQLVESNDQKSD